MQKNTFNRGLYNKIKAEVNTELKNIYPSWDTTQGFVIDGLRNPDEYEKQPLKIMAILGETYGYDKCGVWDIEKYALSSKDLKVPTIAKIGALTWMLSKSLEDHRELSLRDYPGLYKDYKKIKNGLNKIAWVNVKKLSNGQTSRQKNQEIFLEARRGEHVLKKQIDSIAPDLIIVCSDPVMKSVCELNLLGHGLEQNKKTEIQELNETKIIHVSHPSYYRHWSYENFAKIYKTIWSDIKPKKVI